MKIKMAFNDVLKMAQEIFGSNDKPRRMILNGSKNVIVFSCLALGEIKSAVCKEFQIFRVTQISPPFEEKETCTLSKTP